MQKNIKNWTLRLIVVLGIFSSISVLAADRVIPGTTPQQKSIAVSNRLIVKLKPVHLPAGLSSAQIATELRRPFSVETLGRLQTAAGVALTDLHAISNGAHIIRLHGSPDRQTVDRAINNIRGLSEVEYVEEDRILTSQTTDTYYSVLWGMKPVAVVSPALGDDAGASYGADFETAWNNTYTGTGVVVAVVDTGYTAHADLAGQFISAGFDFITDCRIRGDATTTTGCDATTPDSMATVIPIANASDTGDFISPADSTTEGSIFFGMTPSDSSWHGTHVSGTIAAIGNNATGVVGGAYSAKILPVRVLGKGGGYVSDISEGITWAAGAHTTLNSNPAKVINISLGGSGVCSTTEQTAINAAVAAGAVVVVAAGNSNTDVANFSPANCSNIIAVAAIGIDGSRAYYSNYSSPASNYTNSVQVTLAAQGGDMSLTFDPGIYSTVNTGPTIVTTDNYAYYQGTSMAAPHVAAAAALMIARNAALAIPKTLTPSQIKNILAASTTTFPSFSTAGWAAYDCATLKNCGAGILNANLAVQNSISPMTASATDIDFGTQNAFTTTTSTITFSGTAVALGTATITGINSSTFGITSNTCNGSTTPCVVTISYKPVRFGSNNAVLLIPASPATNGAIVVGLTGKGNITLTAAEALAATKGSGGKGGCSIMPAGGNPDISLLLALLAMIAYSFRRRLTFPLGKS